MDKIYSGVIGALVAGVMVFTFTISAEEQIIVSDTGVEKDYLPVKIEKVQSVVEWSGTLEQLNEEIVNYQKEIFNMQERIAELEAIKLKIEPALDNVISKRDVIAIEKE